MDAHGCNDTAAYWEMVAHEYEVMRNRYLDENRLILALYAAMNRDDALKKAVKYRKAAKSRFRRWFV